MKAVLLPLVALTMMASACQPAAPKITDETLARLQNDYDRSQAEIGTLRNEIAALKKAAPPAPAKRAATPARNPFEEPRPAAIQEATSMCFKDYCPCDPPQEGMDSILCDQLEQGMEVDTRMMIAGRGGREMRRQLATGDYR
jgi:anti-sigma factor RsiW